MIRLVEVTLDLRTHAGRVVGTLPFEPGLQVITGKNRIGKSTAFTAIVWCLGVEHIFGTIANDASIFPDAVKAGSRVLFSPPGDDTDGEVVAESRARLVLKRDDGDVLTLTRGITADREKVRFESAAKSGTLTVGYGSFGDETVGFQAALREWARIPNANLMSRTRGKEVPIYMENLASLFIIEQLAGWSDIHAEQVHRYGTIEVDAGAVELLLGEEEALSARLQRQMATAAVNGLRAEARQISLDVAALFESQGWKGDISTGGTLEQLLTRWRDLDLLAVVSQRFNYDSGQERTRLRERVDSLRDKITKGKIDTKSTVDVNEASTHVVGLKQRRHELEQTLLSLRAQHSEQRRLLATTTARQKSATDLQRLKTRGIGILPRAECPTCHQAVDPDMLELTTHTPQSLEVHVDQLDHEIGMLEANLGRLEGEILDVRTQMRRIDEELGAAQTALNMVNQAVGPARETLIKLSNDLVAAERDVQAAHALHDRIGTLQAWIADWAKRATAVVEPSAAEEAMPHRDRFLNRVA